MDFNSVVHRSIKKNHVQELFSRANGQLRRVVLSDTIVSDSAVECLNEQTELQVVRAHRLTRKHAYDLFRACTTLKVLEVLDCQSLSIQTWPKNGARLESASFNVCPVLQSSGISSLVRHSGSELKKLILKAAPSVDSSFFPVLAQRATELEELTLTYSTSIRFQDLRALLQGVWETLSRLDLSVCRGIHSFPDSNELPKLQVLILDKTLITDEGLESIARSAPNLEYLSLQNCRKMADQGIVALANGCSNLQLLDLKGTRVTDIGVQALEDQCSHLRLLRLDSCRNVSREKRHHYASQARELMQRSSLTEYEHILLDRKVMENVQSETESENDSDCSDLSE
ncbi:hypothetical protein Poli38472_000589 [Pythium oligandrum]|uniref:F-box/LRR-repeat protein 15-like leucin rich repeat domain-containing protein n=1 Tax=Pythium oligandrum TaxID=41045 RepID=A0A8K1CC74_PYTOL|nr:hypothetical protein Poli38472_000589 [Pythium oligandrum]|eukprot:TMW60547.1 hypothetical protein Poli38472_000589 [Pythium oligandrum]